jgi:hypothetical protein
MWKLARTHFTYSGFLDRSSVAFLLPKDRSWRPLVGVRSDVRAVFAAQRSDRVTLAAI